MVALGTGNSSRTYAFQSLDALIWSMTILRLRPNPSDPSATWPNVPLEASECGLYFCVKTYRPTLQNGDLQETETVHSNLHHDSQKNNLTSGYHFNISQTMVDGISKFFNNSFTVTHSTYGDRINGWYVLAGQKQFVPSPIQQFWESPDLKRTFESIARSMSNAIRATSDDRAIKFGKNGVLTTYYRIAWPWILFHCVAITAGAIFLVLTMLRTRRSGVPIWKSSSLAVLSRGPYVGELLDGAITISALVDKAATQGARLLGREINRGKVSPAIDGLAFGLPGAEESSVELRVSEMEIEPRSISSSSSLTYVRDD